MENSTRRHLESISIESFLDYKKETFTAYASCSKAQLGWFGNGEFAVFDREKRENHIFDNALEAIEKYTEIVS